MQPVAKLKNLSELVMYFTGKELSDCLKAAEDFAKTRKLTPVHYFIQPPFGASKLTSIISDFTEAKQ